MNQKYIVIVEDDPAIVDVIRIILQDNNFKVTSSDDGEKFLQLIKKKTPDLILLDIWIDGIDGVAITKKLKASKKYRHIPVIMVSANTRGRQLAKLSGADGYLDKPFEIKDLVAIVNKHLGKPDSD